MSYRVFGFSVRRDRREAFRRTAEETAIEMGINVLIAEHEAKSGSIFSIVLGDVSDDDARRYVERVSVARKAS